MTRGPRRPSHRSESAGTCSRCAADPPPGLQKAGGLSDLGAGRLASHRPKLPRRPPLPASLPTGRTVGVAGSAAVGGAGPGLGPPLAELQAVRVRQRRATREAEALLLSCATLGHVHRQPGRPGCVAPHFWAGLGVARLELLGGGGGGEWFQSLQASPHPAPRPLSPVPSPRHSPGRSCHSRRPDGATARRLHSYYCTCSRSPRKPRRWAPGKVYFHYRTWGEGRCETLGRGNVIPGLEDAQIPPPCSHS